MLEDKESLVTEKLIVPRPNIAVVEPSKESALPSVPVTPMLPDVAQDTKQKSSPSRRQTTPSKRDVANTAMFQERCRQLCLSLFFRAHDPVRSLGFTSSIGGEGKSFLSAVTAIVLAHDSRDPVTLLECNWEHPTLHEHFGFPAGPGLAEWLRSECSETAIRHKVGRNLTVIPAGDGRQDAVRLLQRMRQENMLSTSFLAKGLLIIDLPSVTTTAYGSLAADLAQSLVVVVRAGVTPDALITETCSQLKDLPVYGLILNQLESQIPRQIRQLL